MAQLEADATYEKGINIITGISKNARECIFGRINWRKPEIIKTMADTNKFFFQKKLLTRESLEIRKHNSVKNGYNDPQLHVDTKAWHPLLEKLRKKYKKTRILSEGGHGD